MKAAARRFTARAGLQRGLAALEFVFVFPVLFAIFYAIVSYGLIIATQQTLTLAAAEGARAALRYPANPSSVADSISKRVATACSVAKLQLQAFKGGLGTQGACASSGTAHGVYVANAVCPYAGSGTAQCVTVTIRYDYTANQLVPNLPGGLLPMPPALQATAVVQINPEYVL
ncbi:MAG: pilus assembly protein [Comamonadaceae bacterium]|nr:MAG: pilus assembly protein [Comamonadaceae bacterium]